MKHTRLTFLALSFFSTTFFYAQTYNCNKFAIQVPDAGMEIDFSSQQILYDFSMNILEQNSTGGSLTQVFELYSLFSGFIGTGWSNGNTLFT